MRWILKALLEHAHVLAHVFTVMSAQYAQDKGFRQSDKMFFIIIVIGNRASCTEDHSAQIIHF